MDRRLPGQADHPTDVIGRRGDGHDLAVAAAASGWITVLLLTDRWSDLLGQTMWGAATWALLVWLLRGETSLVRTQVAVVVVFATVVEYAFSPLLGVYLYRLGNVPAFVPPGHGLVYLASLALGRWCTAAGLRVVLIVLVLGVGAPYALWGLVGTDRVDVLGAFWFGCLLVFVAVGRSGPLYLGAFVIVTSLELLGTSLHVWQWQAVDPTGSIGMGNPPSGAAGGYAWFDHAATLVAPLLLCWVQRARARLLSLRGTPTVGAIARTTP